MRSSYFRSLFHLSWQKIIGVILLSGFYGNETLFAQGVRYARKFQEHYDDRVVHYGFFFAVPMTRYNVTHSNAFVGDDSAKIIKAPLISNFRMGFVINNYLDEHWDFRTTPSVSFYNRTIEYEFAGGSQRKEQRETACIELPVMMKYKSQRRMNSRMYLVAGLTYGFEVNVRKRVIVGSTRLETRRDDLTLDYGIGFEQFLQYTKFSPEIRFSHGLFNVYRQPENPVSRGIGRLTSHTVTLYLTFE
jgi:Outer membrane protein beta-barrel domain